jgi:hypothetical protein
MLLALSRGKKGKKPKYCQNLNLELQASVSSVFQLKVFLWKDTAFIGSSFNENTDNYEEYGS